ncbi:MAG: DNA topoisomerase IV subunit A [Alphaproteobacteria bacterium]|nr:DNA topoisomerase IV subunit A [Alphaproteobacteria bacterium]
MNTASVEDVPLHTAASERYLNYALSVITARALPDVRDGLKPVQRRILFTMYNEMNLQPGGRYRKCAAVVGEVMGKFHPHGDSSIYDALVRMAQDFTLCAPLVDGQGNFGSLDGDPPAAMRYTECKLRPLAVELLSEIQKDTVDWSPNYDGQRDEPNVLPAQFPQLLVNGSEGIAVGMATKIPPHNLGEVCRAAVLLIESEKDLSIPQLLRTIKGPDFPTGGQILADKAQLNEIYETGSGSVKVRATYTTEKDGRRRSLVITSIPYGQNKAKLIERIGQEVRARKLPQVVDVRDESTDDVRIVLDLKGDASVDAVMAYLFKHTPLQSTFAVNLTALVPGSEPGVARPSKLDLKEMLQHWLDFRFETVRRRYEFDLKVLRDRIHILEGFATIFDFLDEAIAIIRASEGRRDAAEQLMDRFDLTEIQTDAILDLRLYRLAKLAILAIREELAEKLEEAARIEDLLASEVKLWGQVKSELEELGKLYGRERRTLIGIPDDDVEYDEDAYIVKEDTFVVVTRDGWIKRQSSFSDISKIRVRDTDEIGWLIKAHTRSTLTFFSSAGSAYVMRVDDVPSTTGYGEPLQRYFQFADGERVIGVVSHDARHLPDTQESLPLASTSEDDPPPPWVVALTVGGRVLRVPSKAHEEVSTRAGRRYARLNAGDAVLAAYLCTGEEACAVATKLGRAMIFPVGETPILARGGKGSTGIKVRDDDEVVAFELVTGSLQGPEVMTSFGRELVVRERKFGISKRGGRGKVVLKRGSIDEWKRNPIVQLGVPDTPPDDPTEEVEPAGGEA